MSEQVTFDDGWADHPCLYCEEPIVSGETGYITPHLDSAGPRFAPSHWECQARQLVGSVAHQNGTCSCHGGGTGDDEPGMTRREAARAAVQLWMVRTATS